MNTVILGNRFFFFLNRSFETVFPLVLHGKLWRFNELGIGFPNGSDSEESAYNAGDLGSVPGMVRSPGEGKGYLFLYSCLENSMDRGAWQATVCGVSKEVDMTEWVSPSLFNELGKNINKGVK